MKLFHISHTDLDGYGCQLITNEYFKNGFFYNANYGLEVKLSIKKALEQIIQFKEEDIWLLITDLDLTFQESKDLDNDINKLIEEGYKIKLQLLDHHISGKKSAETFSWYFLDDKRCATKIVYDYMVSEFDAFSKEVKSWLSPLVNTINAVDIWLENEVQNFEFGKALMSMITKVREINSVLFVDLNRDFKFYLLKEASKYLNEIDGHIKLDDSVHFMKKKIFEIRWKRWHFR